MRAYPRRHYKILLRQCASKTEFAFVSPAKREHTGARTHTRTHIHAARVYLLQRGKERFCVGDAQAGMRTRTDTQNAHGCTRTCYKTLLRRCICMCVRRWSYDPHASDRETPGPLRLLFTSAYNAISFYSASLPLVPDTSVIVCMRIMSADGATQKEEKKYFQPFPTFPRFAGIRPRTPGVSCSDFDSR